MGSTRLNLSLCNKFDVKCICKVSVFNDLSYYMSIRVQTKYILRENSTSQVSKMNNPPALYSQREARTTTTTEMYLSRNWEMGPQQQFLILDYINNDKPSRMIQSIRDKPISFQSYYIVAFPLCCRGGLWLRRHFSTWHPTTHICNFMLSLLIINKQRPTIAHLSLSRPSSTFAHLPTTKCLLQTKEEPIQIFLPSSFDTESTNLDVITGKKSSIQPARTMQTM